MDKKIENNKNLEKKELRAVNEKNKGEYLCLDALNFVSGGWSVPDGKVGQDPNGFEGK